jgi:hypothetical protein
MGVFDEINSRISNNLLDHGHYLTDPHAQEEEKIAETIDLLMEFVPPDRRDTVRAEIAEIVRREMQLSQGD